MSFSASTTSSSWHHTALAFGADLAKISFVSGGFVASLYIWHEARGPLRAITSSLKEAATDLRYYYDREHPTNIAKRFVSISGVALVGFGYLICEEMKTSNHGVGGGGGISSMVCTSEGCSIVHSASQQQQQATFSAVLSAARTVIQKYFLTPTFFKDCAESIVATSTLFAGVIATKIFFPSERRLLDETTDEEEEDDGDGEDYAAAASAYGFHHHHKHNQPHAPARREAEEDGGDEDEGGDYDDDVRGLKRAGFTTDDEEDGKSGHEGDEKEDTHRGRGGLQNRNNPLSKSMPEMGGGHHEPLRVRREVSREVAALRARRKRWQILRNYFYAPFVEELMFRTVMCHILDSSEVKYPASVKYLLLATGFSLAHLHHVIRHAIQSYQHAFDPVTDDSELTRNAWARGFRRISADLVITGVFTYLNTFLYKNVANQNVIAATVAHGLCNYYGPPSTSYRFLAPETSNTNTNSHHHRHSHHHCHHRHRRTLDDSRAISTGAAPSPAAAKNSKSASSVSSIKRVLRRIKRFATQHLTVFVAPTHVKHSTKIRIISACYVSGICGFVAIVGFVFIRGGGRGKSALVASSSRQATPSLHQFF